MMVRFIVQPAAAGEPHGANACAGHRNLQRRICRCLFWGCAQCPL